MSACDTKEIEKELAEHTVCGGHLSTVSVMSMMLATHPAMYLSVQQFQLIAYNCTTAIWAVAVAISGLGALHGPPRCGGFKLGLGGFYYLQCSCPIRQL
jgi:hypothetical protein